MKAELLAAVVHEMRNPLASILSWSQLLQSGALDRDKSERGFAAIERSVATEIRLIDDLLDFSLAAAGELHLTRRPVDLGSLLSDAIKAQGPASAAKHVQLELAAAPDTGFISGDPQRLHQIARNLIEHSISSAPEGGSVRVILERSGPQLVMSVSDNGQGMSAAGIAQAFEPLRHGPATSLPRRAELALGLATVLLLVELHGGRVAAHSGGPGTGSSFTAYFPALPDAPPTT